MYVNVDIDIDEVLSELSDEDLRQEYNSRFIGLKDGWHEAYDARRAKSTEDFLVYIDTLIMDNTGRIL